MAVILEDPTGTVHVSTSAAREAGQKASGEEPVVSVVIVTWNSAGWIDRCLQSLPSAFGDLTYEVIIHDNASSDGTLSIANAAADRITRVQSSPTNHGFAGGVNRAVANAKGSYILCLNPDCEPEPGSLRTLVDYLDSHPDIAGAVPLLVDHKGLPQRGFQLRRLPSLARLAAEILLADRVLPGNHLTGDYRYRDLDISTPQNVEQPAAAALLLRKSVFDEIGPFDEAFSPAWFEDVDYSMRMMKAGHMIRLVPGAVSRHGGGASLEHVSFDEFLRIWYRNLFRYARKWFRPGEVEVLRWVIIAGMLFRAAASLAGLAKRERERSAQPETYVTVARDAFRRWEDSE